MKRRLAVCILGLALASGQAWADDPRGQGGDPRAQGGEPSVLGDEPPVQAEDPWRIQLTPYVWATSLSGDVRAAPFLPPVDIDKSFGEILGDLDGALFLSGTVRKGRFVFLGDFTYASLSEDRDLRIPPTPITPQFNFPVGARITQLTFTALAGYTVIKEPRFSMDLLGGIRGWHVKATVSIQHTIPFLPTTASETRFWVDPIVAARARYQFARRWSVIGYFDVGGFGAGSDHTWQVVATINYQVADWFFLSAGYRHLSVRYSRDGLNLDLGMSGPLFGATFRF